MDSFEKAWDVAKAFTWADKFRQWAKQNIDSEWYDSEFGIGSEEEPVMGFNYDEWSFEIRDTIRLAMAQTLGGHEEDYEEYADELGEAVEEESWNRATNDMTNPMEGVEYAINMINNLVNDLKRGL